MFAKIKSFVTRLGAYGLIFGVVFFSFSLVNAVKVLNFWINDETDYNEWTVDMGDRGRTDYISNFWGKIQFVNFNGLMNKVLGRHEMNGVIKLNNGYLLTTFPYESDAALQGRVDRLYSLDIYLEQKGIPMLFALCPYTSCKYDPQLPAGISDYGNDNADRFMEMVVEYGIDSIDFREVMYEDGLDQYDMMYKTDHHWTTEAGFYAYQKILKWVEENAGISVDERVADFSNYTRSVYKNWHLGSRGQRTGIYYAGIDDYVLITPDFETSLSHSGMEGSFTELMVNYEPLENKEYTSRYTYDHVMAGASGDWINNNAKNDAKLLIVADSFGTAVNPYMILSFREVRYIYDAASHKLTEEYIEEYDPDIVVLLYYTNCIGSNDFFSFGIGEWESNE